MRQEPDERIRFSHAEGARISTVQIPVRAELRQKLQEIARRDETSLASVARRLIVAGLSAHEEVSLP